MAKKSYKILFIEDEIVLAEMYRDKLVQVGYNAFVAFTAEEGMALTKSEKPDLIMLDILMPGDGGISFLKKRLEDPELLAIPVVVFSNFDDPVTKKEASNLAIEDYLIKTAFTPGDLVKKIKQYLKK